MTEYNLLRVQNLSQVKIDGAGFPHSLLPPRIILLYSIITAKDSEKRIG